MLNNDKETLSRNRRRRIGRNIQIVAKMKSLLNKIKTEPKKKIKKFD